MEKKTNRIAFDVGTYTGDTTDKLLQVYDKVICIDANPNMINLLRKKYTNASVEIIEGCISDSTSNIDFYISTHDDWCSSNREVAERLEKAQIIQVKPLNIVDIIDSYGCPNYLKCDIEGSDTILLRQLAKSEHRPTYISCESECIGNRDIDLSANEDLNVLNEMKSLGYNKFIFVNQRTNRINESMTPFRSYDFENLTDYWLTYDDIKTLMRSVDRNRYPKYHYWFDIIATID